MQQLYVSLNYVSPPTGHLKMFTYNPKYPDLKISIYLMLHTWPI